MAALLLLFTPPNMDEFNHYHALACINYPNSWLHKYTESCDERLGLSLFGIIPWQRSYGYVGITYSILYYPLFLIWPHWISTKVLDLLLMMPGIYAAIKLLNVRLSIAILAMCCTFPILFYTFHNYGQLALQFSLLYVIPWLIYKTLLADSRSKWIKLNVLVAVLLAAGIESKIVFVYFVPSIIVLTLGACWHIRPNIFSLIYFLVIRLWPSFLLFAFLMYALFTADSPRLVWNGTEWIIKGTVPYYQALINFDINRGHKVSNLYLLYTLISNFWLNFYNAAGYYYGLKPMDLFFTGNWDWYGFLLSLPFWLCLIFLFIYYIRCRKRVENPIQLHILISVLVATAASLLAISYSSNAKWGHHILQPFFVFLGAMAMLLQFAWQNHRRIFYATATVLIVSQVACTIYVTSKRPIIHHDWQRMEALSYIKNHDLASRAIINHLSWGTYYISSLYGPKNQIILFQAPIADTVKLSKEYNKNIVYVICCSGNLPLLSETARSTYNMRLVYVGSGYAEWQIWTNADIDPENVKVITDGRVGMSPHNEYNKNKKARPPSFLPFDIPYNSQRLLPLVTPATQRIGYYNAITSRIRLLVSNTCPQDKYKNVRTWDRSPRIKVCNK